MKGKGPDLSRATTPIATPATLHYQDSARDTSIRPCHRALSQISEFFSSPVSNVYCDPTDTRCEFGGVDIEHSLRRCISEEGRGILPDKLKWKSGRSCFAKTFEDMVESEDSCSSGDEEDAEQEREPPRKRLKTARKSPSSRKTVPTRSPSKMSTSKSAKLTQARKGKTATSKPVAAAEPVRKLWGKIAREKEVEWDGDGALKELYAKKQFLPAGLFSSAFKTNKPPDPKIRYISAEGFRFPLPFDCGEGHFEEIDFELPYDIELYMNEAGGPEAVRFHRSHRYLACAYMVCSYGIRCIRRVQHLSLRYNEVGDSSFCRTVIIVPLLTCFSRYLRGSQTEKIVRNTRMSM